MALVTGLQISEKVTAASYRTRPAIAAALGHSDSGRRARLDINQEHLIAQTIAYYDISTFFGVCVTFIFFGCRLPGAVEKAV